MVVCSDADKSKQLKELEATVARLETALRNSYYSFPPAIPPMGLPRPQLNSVETVARLETASGPPAIPPKGLPPCPILNQAHHHYHLHCHRLALDLTLYPRPPNHHIILHPLWPTLPVHQIILRPLCPSHLMHQITLHPVLIY